MTPSITSVGLDSQGKLYDWGDTYALRGPERSCVRGAVLDLRLSQLGRNSGFGARDYLDVLLSGEIPTELTCLRLAAGGAASSGKAPMSVRSLLGGLLLIDLSTTPVKIEPRRGTSSPPANFLNVTPMTADWQELLPIRAEHISASREDVTAAIDRIKSNLALPQGPSSLSRLAQAFA